MANHSIVQKKLNTLKIKEISTKLMCSIGTAHATKRGKRELTVSDTEKLLGIKSMIRKSLIYNKYKKDINELIKTLK